MNPDQTAPLRLIVFANIYSLVKQMREQTIAVNGGKSVNCCEIYIAAKLTTKGEHISIK